MIGYGLDHKLNPRHVRRTAAQWANYEAGGAWPRPEIQRSHIGRKPLRCHVFPYRNKFAIRRSEVYSKKFSLKPWVKP
jgi:hypothetical protein